MKNLLPTKKIASDIIPAIFHIFGRFQLLAVEDANDKINQLDTDDVC